jgi:hypothetical protein
VLGAYFVVYPNATVRGLVVIFPVKLTAWSFLGAWFLYQLVGATSDSSVPTRTAAASPSPPTSAASSSASYSRGSWWASGKSPPRTAGQRCALLHEDDGLTDARRAVRPGTFDMFQGLAS